MTEKRFKFSGHCEVYDTTDTYNTISCTTSLDAEIVYNLLNELSEENEQLKAQLLYDSEDVCNICKHEYLVPSGDYFIGKCKKGHKGCSKEDVKYCEDFEKELKE